MYFTITKLFNLILFIIILIISTNKFIFTNRILCDCNLIENGSNRKCVCDNFDNKSFIELIQIYPELCANNNVQIIEFRNSTEIIFNNNNNNNNDNKLTNLSNCDLNNIIQLNLIGTQFKRLNQSILNGFNNLQTLNLSYNQMLNSYGDRSFLQIGSNLINLISKSNPVRSLTKEVFYGLNKLEKLILSDNKIGYIESGVFSNECCKSIRELRLDHNILTVLDSDSLIGLENLAILDLTNNPLQQLDSNVFIPCASSLIELYMSHDDQATFGGFHSPPAKLFSRLNNLLILEMIELKITNLTSETFNGLNSLKELSLRGNRLIQLPVDIFSALSNLQHLDLAANWLVCIPSSSDPNIQADFISGLPVRWLDLSWNRLTHFNQITARSLSLFDRHTLSQTRLVLNLTANPWQHFDEDSFCNPDSFGITRPIELVIGPLPAIPFSNWPTSKGLWTARAMWPEGPFSLIGQPSLIRGLMLNNDYNEQNSITTRSIDVDLYRGINEAANICEQLKYNKSLVNSSFIPSKFLSFHNLKQFPENILLSSTKSQCSKLPIRKLEDWELNKLKISSLIIHIEDMTHSSLTAFEQGSRLYLLIIIAICITFLFVALTVIMCYRAWSRRVSQKFHENDLENCGTGVMINGISADKPLLLKHCQIYQDGTEKSYLSNQSNHNSDNFCNGDLNSTIKTEILGDLVTSTDINHCIQNTQLNQIPSLQSNTITTIVPATSTITTNTTTNALISNNNNNNNDNLTSTTDSIQISSTYSSNLDTNPLLPPTDRLSLSIRGHVGRPKSDPETVSDIDEVNRLTSLGIV